MERCNACGRPLRKESGKDKEGFTFCQECIISRKADRWLKARKRKNL